MIKLDELAAQLNEETNAISTKIEAMGLKVGDVVTQDHVETLQAVCNRLKSKQTRRWSDPKV